MKIYKIKYCLILFILYLLNCRPVSSQSLIGEFVDVYTNKSKDTIISHRQPGPLRIGITGGVNTNLYFGTLNIPRQPDRPPSLSNPLINFPGNLGLGMFIGLTGTWVPIGENWGITVNANLFDYRSSTSESDPFIDTISTNFKNKINFTYLSLSPSIRYNLPINGLHLLGGLDFEYLAAYKATYIQVDETSSHNEKEWKIPNFAPVKFRAGLHIGIGYDIFAGDINHDTRIFFTPFMTFEGGTNVINQFSSSRNTITGKIGLSISFGKDITKTDTLFYDSNAPVVPPSYYASIIPSNTENRVLFGGFSEWYAKPSGQLAYIEETKISEEIAEAPVIKVEESAVPKVENKIKQNIKQPKKPQLKVGSSNTLAYDVTSNVKLNKTQMSDLDKYVEYLKANPKLRLKIDGHSDESGTPTENDKRARQRTEEVVKYFISKGINRRRLYDASHSSFYPAASNLTEDGRRKNRRVEIKIIR